MGCFSASSDDDCLYRVELLDDSAFNVSVKGREKGEDLMNRVLAHLNLVEKDYFGLRYLDDLKNTHWLDLQEKIKSQLRKRRAVPVFYFGVKFYAADPCKLHEEITRYHYFLQLRRDVAQGRIPLGFDACVELCALIIQADVGDRDEQRHGTGYVSEFRLTPNQSEELEEAVAAAHRSLKGMIPANAEMNFLQKVKDQEMYGVDLHRARVRDVGELFIGLTPSGVVIFRNQVKAATFSWPDITNVSFNSKEFSLRVAVGHDKEDVRVFELPSNEACQHLWKCCVEHHSFFRLSKIKEKRAVRTSGFFSFGSKYRYSGRTEWQALSEAPQRPPPLVPRRPSRRQENRQRRYRRDEPKGTELTSTESKRFGPQPASDLTQGVVSRIAASSASGGADSPRSVRSAPWAEQPAAGGLFTSGRDSPKSVRSERIRFPGRTMQSRANLDGSGNQSMWKRRHETSGSDHPAIATAGLYDRYHKHAPTVSAFVSRGGVRPRRPVGEPLSQVDYSSPDAAAILAADAYYVNVDQCEAVSKEQGRHRKVSRRPREPPPRKAHAGTAAANADAAAVAVGPARQIAAQLVGDAGWHPAIAERRSNASEIYYRKPPPPPVARSNEAFDSRAASAPEKRQRAGSEAAGSLSAVLLMSHAPLVKMHSGNGSVHAVAPGTYSMSAKSESRVLIPSQSFKVSII